MTVSLRFRASLSALTVALLAAGCATPGAVAPQAPVAINIVSFNDFHGNLEPSRYTFNGANGKETLRAGGVEAVAAALQAWRREDKDLLLVSTGDILGASPALSSMWADEPTIEAMDLLGLRVSAVGNHEFDAGRKELLRQQHGGCDSPRPAKACQYKPDFSGAKFTYLAANVIDKATGKPFMPAYRIEDVKGVKVGLVGVVLQGTASVAIGSAIAGLEFTDEAEAINRAIPAMRAQGAKLIVALVHEGGITDAPSDKPGCTDLKGGLVDIVKKLDPQIRLVLSGHSHYGYLCTVDGRTVTQAASAGHLLTRVTMKVDPVTGAVADIDARNEVMRPGAYPADPKMAALVEQVKARSKAELTKPVARLAAAPVLSTQSESGEAPLGALIADAVLAAGRADGAQIGLMNIGGVRRDLEATSDGTVTFGHVQAVLPFGNSIVIMDLSGEQLRTLLEQQWDRPPAADLSVLQWSEGFTYRWDSTKPPGKRVIPGSIKLHGVPVQADKTYRVALNNFLAEGGDHFPEFAKGTKRVETGILDLDALIEHLRSLQGKGAAALAPAPRYHKEP